MIFAHGSGSSRLSPRNRAVAARAQRGGLRDAPLRPAGRARGAAGASWSSTSPCSPAGSRPVTRWASPAPPTRGLPIGYFGASTGAAAALRAAAAAGRRGPRGRLARRPPRPGGRRASPTCRAPTLLIVGSRDREVLELNRRAAALLRCPHRIAVVRAPATCSRSRARSRTVARLAARLVRATSAGRAPSAAAAAGAERGRPARASARRARDRVDAVRRDARPLTGDRRDYDALLALIGDARVVLLGEASHGTHEFYRERARITKRLIARARLHRRRDRGRLARRLPGQPLRPRRAARTRDAEEALRGFRRFPTWMWRNADVLDFVGWLRAHNDGLARRRDAGSASTGSTSTASAPRWRRSSRYLDEHDPEAAERARAALRVPPALRGRERRLRARPCCSASASRAGGRSSTSWSSCAAAPATTCAGTASSPRTSTSSPSRTRPWSPNAEEYYRTMFGDRAASWNLRDRHMADTLDQLLAHLDRHGGTHAASSSGSTTPTSATRAPRRWPSAASSTSAS